MFGASGGKLKQLFNPANMKKKQKSASMVAPSGGHGIPPGDGGTSSKIKLMNAKTPAKPVGGPTFNPRLVKQQPKKQMLKASDRVLGAMKG